MLQQGNGTPYVSSFHNAPVPVINTLTVEATEVGTQFRHVKSVEPMVHKTSGCNSIAS